MAVFLVADWIHRGSAWPPGRLAYLGAILATFTYFIPRSDSANGLTLVALWIGLWICALARFWDEAPAALRNTHYFLLFLVTSIFLPFSINYAPKRLGIVARAYAEAFRWVSPEKPSAKQMPAIDSVRKSAVPLARLLVMDFPIPPIALPSFSYVPWLPSHPLEEFLILPPPRREEYLRRYLSRCRSQEGQLLFREGALDEAAAQTRRMVETYYRLEKVTRIPPDLVLELYRRREPIPPLISR
jgi:hypothetical protein